MFLLLMNLLKMKQIKIEKVTLNIGTGEPGDKLEKAMKLLNTITGAKPVQTKSKKRIPTWGVRPGLAIGCKVTLRGNKANEVLKKLLIANENKLSYSKFDDKGNLAFGIKEYIDIADVKYDPEIGIIGLEAAVTLARPGFRIKRRTIKKSHIPTRHQVSKEDAINFMQKEFGVKVE